jgi:hypothetical protein
MYVCIYCRTRKHFGVMTCLYLKTTEYHSTYILPLPTHPPNLSSLQISLRPPIPDVTDPVSTNDGYYSLQRTDQTNHTCAPWKTACRIVVEGRRIRKYYSVVGGRCLELWVLEPQGCAGGCGDHHVCLVFRLTASRKNSACKAVLSDGACRSLRMQAMSYVR